MLRTKRPDDGQDIIDSGRHWQVMNFWRPLKTIYKDPFALTDATSVPDSDLIVYSTPNKSGQGPPLIQTYFVQSGSGEEHQWYYLSEMRPDEVVAFKIYESDPSCKAQRVVHTAVKDPGMDNKDTRESLELRTILIY
jgi:hypothetical protein